MVGCSVDFGPGYRRLAKAATLSWPQILCGVDQEAGGTDLNEQGRGGALTPPCLRRLRPPEGCSLFPKILPMNISISARM
jgi:hypothetical protein